MANFTEWLQGATAESDWYDYTASQSSSIYQAPNAAPVPVNRPSVDTGQYDWGGWFERVVGSAVMLRNSGRSDARETSYPGTGYEGQTMAGQPLMQGGGTMTLLLLGGMALAAFMILKD